MESLCRVIHNRLRSSIVIASDAFAKVIGLHAPATESKVVARELPVDLVKIVTHQDRRSYDSHTRCSLHHNVNSSEEEVVARPGVGGIPLLCEAELSTICAVVDSFIIRLDPV